jgi:hypothetical protein
MRNANSSPDFTFEIPRVVQSATKMAVSSNQGYLVEARFTKDWKESGCLRAKPTSAKGSLTPSSHREHQLGLAFVEIRCHTVHFAKI